MNQGAFYTNSNSQVSEFLIPWVPGPWIIAFFFKFLISAEFGNISQTNQTSKLNRLKSSFLIPNFQSRGHPIVKGLPSSSVTTLFNY